MAMHQCPGMNPGYFKPKDIQVYKCINCKQEIEFWKDDIKIKCSKCGQVNFNPNLGNTCLVWCKEASKCIGKEVDIKEWIEKNKNITPERKEVKGKDKSCP